MKINYFKLSKKEINLISLIRGTRYGEVKIIVLGKQPIRAVEIQKNIKL